MQPDIPFEFWIDMNLPPSLAEWITTKDIDFVNLFEAKGHPPKILYVNTGISARINRCFYLKNRLKQ